jgi:hypothetical protein
VTQIRLSKNPGFVTSGPAAQAKLGKIKIIKAIILKHFIGSADKFD